MMGGNTLSNHVQNGSSHNVWVKIQDERVQSTYNDFVSKLQGSWLNVNPRYESLDFSQRSIIEWNKFVEDGYIRISPFTFFKFYHTSPMAVFITVISESESVGIVAFNVRLVGNITHIYIDNNNALKNHTFGLIRPIAVDNHIHRSSTHVRNRSRYIILVKIETERMRLTQLNGIMEQKSGRRLEFNMEWSNFFEEGFIRIFPKCVFRFDYWHNDNPFITVVSTGAGIVADNIQLGHNKDACIDQANLLQNESKFKSFWYRL